MYAKAADLLKVKVSGKVSSIMYRLCFLMQ